MVAEQLRILVHDLRGPGMTLKGFVDELMIMTEEISAELDEHSDVVVPDTKIADLLNTELLPSLRCLRAIEQQLNSRIDQAASSLEQSE
jgi:hypothetical protein